MSDTGPTPSRLRFFVALYALLAVGLTATALFFNPFFFLPGSTKEYATVQLAARAILIAVAVWAGLKARVLLEKRWEILDKSLSSTSLPLEIPNGDLAGQQQDIESAIALIRRRYTYNTKVVGLFAKMLASSSYQLRVTERAELLGNSVRMSVSIDYAMTAIERQELTESSPLPVGGADSAIATDSTIAVPVLKVSKGTLLDHLDVTDNAGSSLSVLSQKEARGLVALALETLFYLTFDKAATGSEEEKLQEAALWSLRRFVSQTGRIRTGDVDAASLESAFYKSIVNLQSPAKVARLKDLENFCCFFAENYVIVADVPVPPGVRFIVKYTKAVPLYGRSREPNRWRMRLGLAPYKFWVPLNLAFTAESYHFRMDIGEGQFVADQYLADGSSGEHLSLDEVRKLTSGGYVRVREGSGLPYAHLYTRGLDKCEKQTNLITVVKFEEVPPGALGATAVVAAVSAALVSLMTFMRPDQGPNADTAALLFAVPLFAATLVGHSIDRVQRSSLATYCALAVTGVTAFLGAVLFGLVPGLFFVENVTFLGLFDVPGINIGGLVIAVAAIGNVIFLLWRLRFKVRRYVQMLKRWDSPHLIRRETR